MNEDRFRKLISGQKNGPFAATLRAILYAVSLVYAALIRLRNFGYRTGVLKTIRAPIPIISVGNLTTGGTGKTPLVIWLVQYLCDKQVPSAVLTRGYKTSPGKISDEPAILAKSCGNAEIVVDPDRVRGVTKALRHNAKIAIMDDGFQHRKLKRDLDILTIDATCPFGYGNVLPAGFLREPIASLRRADITVLTRCDQVQPQSLEKTINKIKKIAPGIPIIKTVHSNPFIRIHRGGQLPIEELRDRKIMAFCGIGNPDAFIERIEKLGLNLVGKRTFNDHFNYRPSDITRIVQHAELIEADLILTTQKDWVKTALLMEKHCQKDFGYLALKLDFLDGPDTMTAKVDTLL